MLIFDPGRYTIICRKCGRTGHYANQCWAKEKIKNLDIDDNIKEIIYNIIFENNSETDHSKSYYSTDTSDKKDDDSIFSEEECENCKKGKSCINHISNTYDNENENIYEKDEEFYKLLSQFKDLNINTLTDSNILEFLKRVKDPNLRAQIIDQMEDIPSTSKKEEVIISSKNDYSMVEVNKLLKNKYNNQNPITIQDLLYEVNNLKNDVEILKDNNYEFHNRISAIEKGKNISVEEQFEEISFEKKSSFYYYYDYI